MRYRSSSSFVSTLLLRPCGLTAYSLAWLLDEITGLPCDICRIIKQHGIAITPPPSIFLAEFHSFGKGNYVARVNDKIIFIPGIDISFLQ